jgi:PAS domain S-box-containing protein
VTTYAGEAYRALFENSLDAVFFTAPDGQVFAANPAACAMFGCTEAELCALGREGVFDPADRERAAVAVAGRATAGQIRTVLSYRRRDGTTFPGEVSSRIFTDGCGEQRACIVLRDVTEREQMQERLAGQLRQTQTANDQLAAFTNYVVHDLRVPLRALNGYSLVLAADHGDRLDDAARNLLDRIGEASRKMDTLLHDLLRWSRLGREELHRAPADLSAMARTSAAQLAAGDPARDVTFRIADGVAGSADLDLIRTVLDNLLGNAWKYTARQPRAAIEFGATTSADGLVTYFVADNGDGFDPAYADHLFQPFQRLHGGDFPGTGLGLASVRRIVERHGGRVWAEGAVDHGATFSFTLDGAAGALLLDVEEPLVDEFVDAEGA